MLRNCYYVYKWNTRAIVSDYELLCQIIDFFSEKPGPLGQDLYFLERTRRAGRTDVLGVGGWGRIVRLGEITNMHREEYQLKCPAVGASSPEEHRLRILWRRANWP